MHCMIGVYAFNGRTIIKDKVTKEQETEDRGMEDKVTKELHECRE